MSTMPSGIFLALLFLVDLSESCSDAHPNCKDWKDRGFCTIPFFQNYQLLCQQTCGLCTAGCVDLDPTCAIWSRNGFCFDPRFRQFWIKCPRTCGICDAGSCRLESQIGPCQTGMTCPRGYYCSKYSNPPVCCPA